MLVNRTGSPNGWASFFWAAFERSANPMTLLHPDRVLVAINEAGVHTFGYAPHELIGRRTDLLLAPSQWKRLEADWAVIRRTGRLCGERELIRADGRHLQVQFAAHREVVTGRQLVLWVVVESRLRPLTLHSERDGASATLTPRELEIVMEIALGRRAREIAADLHIAPSTVKTHVRNAMVKVGAHSQAQLVAIALATGMLDPGSVDTVNA